MDALRLLSRSTDIRARQSSQSKTAPLPSEGQDSATGGTSIGKRKREDDEVDADLSEDSIREIQSKHKIRIVNLRKLQKTSTSKTKKQQKESARLFPQPLTSFKQLRSRHGVGQALEANISAQAYYDPSEVQMAAVPVLLTDPDHEPDLLTVAPTGSGKTLAFLIPTIEKIRRDHKVPQDRHIRAIILAPTKELVGQIVNEGRKLCANTGVSITAMRKGMKLNESPETALEENSDSDEEADSQNLGTVVKTDILVSTPLSIAHALGSGELPSITSLILDEADVLLDALFREQTLSIWSACTSPTLRVSLWSATIGSNIEELAVSTISDRRKRLAIKQKAPLYRIIIGLKDSSLPSISHKLIYAATEPGKLLGLRQLLHPSRPFPYSSASRSTQSASLRPPFLVFTQTISRATALYTELQYDIPPSAGGSSRIAVLHSDLSTSARSAIMTKFRAGQIWVLITTDLLSRGVDFRGVNGVVNYDIPTTTASYIHRAGRTGRAGREGGVCVTLYTRDDVKYLKAIASVIKASTANGTTGTEGPAAEANNGGLDSWLMHALPALSKNDRKELKQRGVETRRAIKESDDAEERKRKRKNRIGTKSGWEKREENRKKGAVVGSKARKRRENGGEREEGGGNDFEGFD